MLSNDVYHFVRKCAIISSQSISKVSGILTLYEISLSYVSYVLLHKATMQCRGKLIQNIVYWVAYSFNREILKAETFYYV